MNLHARIPVPVQDWLGVFELPEAVKSFNSDSDASCDIDENMVEAVLGVSDLSTEKCWERTSCAELFSEMPPAWLRPAVQDKLHLTNREWWPLGSLSIIQQKKQKFPKQSLKDHIHRYQNAVVGNDLCAFKEANRYDQAYAAPSQKDAGFVDTKTNSTLLVSQAQREKYKKEAEKMKLRLANICCGGDNSCWRRMNSVVLEWCEPQASSSKADAQWNGKMPLLSNGPTEALVFKKELPHGATDRYFSKSAWENLKKVALKNGPIKIEIDQETKKIAIEAKGVTNDWNGYPVLIGSPVDDGDYFGATLFFVKVGSKVSQ